MRDRTEFASMLFVVSHAGPISQRLDAKTAFAKAAEFIAEATAQEAAEEAKDLEAAQTAPAPKAGGAPAGQGQAQGLEAPEIDAPTLTDDGPALA